MFVHLVEEGLAESIEAELLAHHYLDDRPELDSLILGCTHYPVLRSVIQRVSGGGVHLVDSAEAISETVSVTLANCPPGSGRITHFVTGDSIAYEHTAHVIGGVDGAIVPLPVAELVALQKVAAAVSLSLRKQLHS
jgi:glutamate racemase